MKRNSLGKGLSALLKEEILSIHKDDIVQMVDINRVEPRSYQPRKKFEQDKIKELADSIANSGLLQPIIVSPKKDSANYEIVAGERRWRACMLNNFSEIPVIIRHFSEKEILEVSLIENIQREELSVIEEAAGFEKLIKEFSYTQDQLAVALGKSRSHIANLLRLNQLPQSIKDKISGELLTMGHGRCLIGHEHAETIADYIIENDLSVRQAENIAKNWKKREYTKMPNSKQSSISGQGDELKSLANSLSEKFNMKITIEDYVVGGKLIFHYGDLEQLDIILSRLH